MRTYTHTLKKEKEVTTFTVTDFLLLFPPFFFLYRKLATGEAE